MLSTILALPSWVKTAGILALAVAISGAFGYTKGRVDGRDLARKEALQATVNQLKERNATDAEIRNMGDADLCTLLGGVFANGECQ